MAQAHDEAQAALDSTHSALYTVHRLSVDQQDHTSPLISASTFEDLNLSQDLLKGVYSCGYAKPSKIQEAALPLMLRDPPQHLIAQAQTGTGKTAAFCLAILSRLDYNNPATQAIVLSPSRELARQIVSVMQSLAKFTPAVVAQVVPELEQRRQQIEGHVVVGTPGKVADMIKRPINLNERGPQARKFIDVSKVKILVLDEADCMLDLQGLGDQSVRIKRHLPRNIQLIFFSATWDNAVLRFAESFIGGTANTIRLQAYELTLEYVKQFYIDCDSEEDRFRVLVALYGIMTISQSIIFVERRHVAEMIAKRMIENHHHVSFLHGGLPADERDIVMDAFRKAETKVLITTNVLARGIDIERVNMVINYDLPLKSTGEGDPVMYLHRIGRTGRFGRTGVSVNFVHDLSAWQALHQIQNHYSCKITQIPTGFQEGDGDNDEDRHDARLNRMEASIKKALKE